MVELLVGTGGWSYFTEGPLALKRYSKYFRMVEVNSTFYSHPSDSTLRRWREQAPPSFVFTLKAHRDITHGPNPATSSEIHESLIDVSKAAEILKAEVIVFQYPPNQSLNSQFQQDFQNLFSSVNFGSRIAVELRTPQSNSDYKKFLLLLESLGFLQVTDLCREQPHIASDLLYSRIFGQGHENLYQFSDDELFTLNEETLRGEWKKAFLVFHTIGMYTDAARMENYHVNGDFLPVSRSTGVDSVLEMLGLGVFPSWRSDLISNHGWKLCDLRKDTRVRLSELLVKIPERLYMSATDLRDELSKVQL